MEMKKETDIKIGSRVRIVECDDDHLFATGTVIELDDSSTPYKVWIDALEETCWTTEVELLKEKTLDNLEEQWREVVYPGFENLYEISNLGNLRSRARFIITSNSRNKYLKPKNLKTQTAVDSGYSVFRMINLNGRKKRLNIHRAVALAFIPTIVGKDSVNHKNGDKSDNKVTNLEWVSNSENMRHSWETGLRKNFGQNSRYAKLKFSDVLEIVEALKKGDLTQVQIAKNHSVDPVTIWCIKHGKTWKFALEGVNNVKQALREWEEHNGK